MHPSSPSSSDPNAPYRAAIASLVDCNFFADERVELAETAHPTNQQDPFVGLSQRGMPQRFPTNRTAEATPSSAASVSIDTIRQYLREKGYRDCNLLDETIETRLEVANLSAATYFSAMQILHTPGHPLSVDLGLRHEEIGSLIYKLSGIFTRKNGFTQSLKRITLNCNNNPVLLLSKLLENVRDPNQP